jgi:hypothetical protein
MQLDYDQLLAKKPGKSDAKFAWHCDLAYALFLPIIDQPPSLSLPPSLPPPSLSRLPLSPSLSLLPLSLLPLSHSPVRDRSYWPPTRDTRTATFSLAVDPSTPANGCLKVVPGSHKEKALRNHYPLGNAVGTAVLPLT